MAFKDHFSHASSDYRRFRPRYPDELFRWLADRAPGRGAAADLATGNGQAAVALAERFEAVWAFDASEAQVAEAEPHPRVRYGVARAEALPLPDASLDLITVAQALHWFDHAAFFAEAGRVLRPGGVVAAWCYAVHTISPEVDAVVHRLYTEITGPFWPPERRILEGGYADVVFPPDELVVPAFSMEARWDVEGLLGYLRTWSASKRYEAALGQDPVALVEAELRTAFGPGMREIRWPLAVRAARNAPHPPRG